MLEDCFTKISFDLQARGNVMAKKGVKVGERIYTKEEIVHAAAARMPAHKLSTYGFGVSLPLRFMAHLNFFLLQQMKKVH